MLYFDTNTITVHKDFFLHLNCIARLSEYLSRGSKLLLFLLINRSVHYGSSLPIRRPESEGGTWFRRAALACALISDLLYAPRGRGKGRRPAWKTCNWILGVRQIKRSHFINEISVWNSALTRRRSNRKVNNMLSFLNQYWTQFLILHWSRRNVNKMFSLQN